MSRNSLSLFLAISLPLALPIVAQTPATSSNDAVRVTVSLNADGSRTVYQIGDAGRFVSGIVFGPDGKFLFKSIYKCDAAGRVEQETHLAKDDAVINKIVYKYNSAGKQIGYTVFDAAGKLVSGTSSPAPTAAPKAHKTLGR